MNVPRMYHTATKTTNGAVVIVGGDTGYFGSPTENRNRQHHRFRGRLCRCLRCRFQHFAAARSMHRQHADAKLGGLVHRGRHGVWDVVEFQVEKNLTAGGDQIAYDLRPLSRKELLPYFVSAGRFANGLNDLAGLRGAGYVQRHDEPISVKHRPILPHDDRTIADLRPVAGRSIGPRSESR